MLGIFDSGKGALAVLDRVRELYPSADITVLCDTENAPYGTKEQDEILAIVRRNLLRLVSAGASRVLIGCCTASTVYERLGKIERAISTPIIYPTVKAAVRTTLSGKIGVLATAATVRSHAFSDEIRRLAPECTVVESAAGELVELVEGWDGKALSEKDSDTVRNSLLPFLDGETDTLVLGCTHFPHLAEEIRRIAPELMLVRCDKCGAEFINPLPNESGRTVFL